MHRCYYLIVNSFKSLVRRHHIRVWVADGPSGHGKTLFRLTVSAKAPLGVSAIRNGTQRYINAVGVLFLQHLENYYGASQYRTGSIGK